MRIAVLAFFFFLGSALGAFAQQGGPTISQPENHLSGKDLLGFCKSNLDVDQGYCAGYMSAIGELLLDHPLYRMGACGHGKVRSQQFMEIFKDHLERYPERTDVPASMAAVEALSVAFPCHNQ